MRFHRDYCEMELTNSDSLDVQSDGFINIIIADTEFPEDVYIPVTLQDVSIP